MKEGKKTVVITKKKFVDSKACYLELDFKKPRTNFTQYYLLE